MILIFEHQDLASFGNYLLSERRAAAVKAAYDPDTHLVPEKQWMETVRSEDIQQWMLEEDQKRKAAAVQQ